MGVHPPDTPSYLRPWHTGNGSGRSSLCCSSPRWRLPPGSGNISEREGVTPSAPQTQPTPRWSEVSLGPCPDSSPWCRMRGRFLTHLRPPPPPGGGGQQDPARASQTHATAERARGRQAAGPWDPALRPATCSLELRADLACLFLLGTSRVEGEGKMGELYINLLEF